MTRKYAGSMLPMAQPRPDAPSPGPDPCAACSARFLSVCAATDDDHLPALAELTTPVEVEAHRTFVMAGEPANHLFNITEGVVKVYRLLPDGRQQITGFLFTGDFLGLAPGSVYAFSAEAVTRVRYCRFARKPLERFLGEVPEMQKKLLTIASNELAAAQEQMVLLGRKTAREKLASFLIALSHRVRRLGKSEDALDLPMTRADIADYLGLTTETVSRTFTRFRAAGLIELPKAGGVRLRDRAALAAIGDGN
jgi:CRP/FNR family transcriptional regulator